MRKLTPADVESMRALRAEGHTLAAIGARFGLHGTTVRYWLARFDDYHADRPRPEMNSRERRLYRAMRAAGISVNAIADWFDRDIATISKLTRDTGPRATAARLVVPENVRASIVAALADHHTLRAVAAAHGVHPATVRRIGDAAGIPRVFPRLGRRVPRLTPRTRRAILSDLASGRTRTATAAAHGVSRQTVQMLARGAGLTRPRAVRSPATESAH